MPHKNFTEAEKLAEAIATLRIIAKGQMTRAVNIVLAQFQLARFGIVERGGVVVNPPNGKRGIPIRLEILQALASGPKTTDEIARWLGCRRCAIRSRMPELTKLNLVGVETIRGNEKVWKLLEQDYRK